MAHATSKSYADAVSWFSKAAEQNFVNAQLYLGLCYEAGLGVAADVNEAIKWYKRSADSHFAQTGNTNCGAMNKLQSLGVSHTPTK